MAASPSPPTERVLDIIEMVSANPEPTLRAADLARELGLSRATAHAIIHALCSRGWLVRSDAERVLSLGPAVVPVGMAAAAQRRATRAAIDAARRLSSMTGYAASVVELVDETMFVSTVGSRPSHPVQTQRIRYAAPFGSLFAAWSPIEQRRDWIVRGGVGEGTVSAYLSYLDRARENGVLIERMSPIVEHVSSLVAAADAGSISAAMRELVAGMVEEVVRSTVRADRGARQEYPVTSIAAPLARRDGGVVSALVIHPLTVLPEREGRRLASLVKQVANAVETARI